MSFQERFKQRTTFLNKEGVIGMVSQASNPIEKTPTNGQVNYSSKQMFLKESNSDFSSLMRANQMGHSRETSFPSSVKSNGYDGSPNGKAFSRANFFQDNGNLTLKLDLQRAPQTPQSLVFQGSKTPQVGRKLNTDSAKSFTLTQSTDNLHQKTTAAPEKFIIYTNIQNPQQRQATQGKAQGSQSALLPFQNNQQSRVRIAVNPNSQHNLPIKPIRNVAAPPQNSGKGFHSNGQLNFENPYLSKYQAYEYNGYQNSEAQNRPIQYQQQSPSKQYYTNAGTGENQFQPKIQFFANNQPLPSSVKNASGSLPDLGNKYINTKISPQKQRGNQSEEPSPINSQNKGDLQSWRGVSRQSIFNGDQRSESRMGQVAHRLTMGHMDHSFSDGEGSEPIGFKQRGGTEFKPYTLKQYRDLQQKNDAGQRGGLGANIGSEEWKAKNEKMEKMQAYSQNSQGLGSGNRGSSVRVMASHTDNGRDKTPYSGSMFSSVHDNNTSSGNLTDVKSAGLKFRRTRLSQYSDWDPEGQRERSLDLSRSEGRFLSGNQLNKLEKQQLKILNQMERIGAS